eukprot:8044306-Pyramimonas_sp.AAC.1
MSCLAKIRGDLSIRICFTVHSFALARIMLAIADCWERYTTAANAPGNPFQGLRVRMGIHKGDAEVIKYPTRARQMYKGAAVQVAKAVSNAASGGQILMSGDVMAAVDIRHGCPKENENNESQSRVTAVKPFSRDTLSRRNVREKG